MKKIYNKPEVEIIIMEKEDLLTKSGTVGYGSDWPGDPDQVNNI